MNSYFDVIVEGIDVVYQMLVFVDYFDLVVNMFLGNELIKIFFGIIIFDNKCMCLEIECVLFECLGVWLCLFDVLIFSFLGGQWQVVVIVWVVYYEGLWVFVMDELIVVFGFQEMVCILKLIMVLKVQGFVVILIFYLLDDVFEVVDRVYVQCCGWCVGVVKVFEMFQ